MHIDTVRLVRTIAIAVLLANGCALAVPTGPLAATLEMRVYPLDSDVPAALPLCKPDTAHNCATTLTNAFSTIQNPTWQAALPGRFTAVKLQLAPGTYRLAGPLQLKWGSGATLNVRLEISGTPKTTVISGAVPVGNWTLATASNTPQRTSSAARGKLLMTNVAHLGLPTHVIPTARGFGLPIRPAITELFVDNAIQPLAAWPNSGFGKLTRSGQLSPEDKKTFSIEGRSVSDWADEPDLQVHAFWGNDWAAQSYLISGKDIGTNSLSVLGAGSPYGVKQGQRARVENALAELDTPGEWYLDRATANLFYLPTVAFKGSGAELSVATGLLNIESSENILVRDLTFEKTRGDAVFVKKSHHTIFDNVVIRMTGNRAVVLDDCSASGIRNSLIEDNGEGGVYLAGGDRATLQSAGNFLENSVVRRFSRLAFTYRFAADLSGVGQRVTGNTISDAPHTAILFRGNDHLISNNEIFDVVRETSDAGAIYVGRDFTARGTVIENNFFHDINASSSSREVKGVYVDDQSSGITVRGNVFARVQQPVFLSGGRDNLVEENLFFRSSPAVHLDARGLGSQRQETLNPKGTLQRGLDAVPYRGTVYSARYPHLSNIREDELGAPKYNTFKSNIIVEGRLHHISPDAHAGLEVRDNTLASESIFEKAISQQSRILRGDFKLKK